MSPRLFSNGFTYPHTSTKIICPNRYRREIGAGRHVPPGICALTLNVNPAWADLRPNGSSKRTRHSYGASQPSNRPDPTAPPADAVNATGSSTTTAMAKTTELLVPSAS